MNQHLALAYKQAFEAARAFIDSHAADPDITSEMVQCYSTYQDSLKRLEAAQKHAHYTINQQEIAQHRRSQEAVNLQIIGK